MILTGIAKEDFLSWINKRYLYSAELFGTSSVLILHDIFGNTIASKTHRDALIIEWLDTVGIYIEISGINDDRKIPVFMYNIQEDGTINGNNGHEFKSRQQATEAAIKLANEIYNNKA